MSIVLVIIGLVIGGVIVGKDLIHNSRLNSIISDVNQYKAAVNAYQMKYDWLPGDHPTAYDAFDGSGGSAVCGTNAYAPPAGCNGNGNSQIDWGSSERFRTWQHLTLSEILKGSYSGTSMHSSLTVHELGTNTPPSLMKGAGYQIRYNISWDDRGHVIEFGALADNGAGTIALNGPILTTAEAKMIDTKYDNGHAGLGRLHGRNGANITGCTGNTRDYVLSNSGARCYLLFFID